MATLKTFPSNEKEFLRANMKHFYRWPFLTIMTLALLLVAQTAGAAPKADLWPRWEKNDPANKQKVDHSAWDAFLKKYIVVPHPSGINRVNYATVAPEDRTALANYVKSLKSVAVSGYSRAEQRAYWIGGLEHDYDWRLNAAESKPQP